MSLDDLTSLLHGAAEYAVDQLCNHARLMPFAVTLDTQGNIKFVTEDSGKLSLDEEILSSFRPELQKGADDGALKAIAIVTDKKILDPTNGQPTQAIAVACEHLSHDPVLGCVPYTLDGEKINLGDLFLDEGENVFFQASQSS